MPLFEVAILQTPDKDGKGEQLISGPKAIVAKDTQMAALVAGQGLIATDVDYSRLQVLVRPFA